MSQRQWKAKRSAQKQSRIQGRVPFCDICGASETTLLRGQLASGEEVERCVEHSALFKRVLVRLEFVPYANERERLAVQAMATTSTAQVEQWADERPEGNFGIAAARGFFVIQPVLVMGER